MSKWPVVDPPKPPLHTNLGAVTLVSPKQVFNGPLNVLIQLQGTAQGAVELSKTKDAYDSIPVSTPLVDPRAADDDDDETLADG
ncbi:hypothetical protein ABH975_003460 [Bradyrhizobium ottawaense]|uniref:hypothetical protein n=1 Tax=Bradyrhizobium ottawaense TaxID=931866 RepID=UPI003511B27F